MTSPPASTYRLQIRPSFDLDAAASVTGYLRDLGVSWAYLSPLLTATSGSDHGYDVVDPARVDPARGGEAGLDRFAAAARQACLGILVDIVPNHMGVSQPRENPWWWDLLRLGPESAYADAFDLDREYGDGRVRLPVLGGSLEDALRAGEIVIDPEPAEDAPSGVIRYFDHVFPLAPGSLDDAGPATGSGRVWNEAETVRAVLARQHYELRYWRDEAAELNYRRFFAVTTLAGIRVERPEVFDAAHAEILRWVRAGLVDGLRVDHPDGLLNPGAYLDRLSAALRDAQGADASRYVLVEKILEHGEELPGWWATEGTTGYDALAEFGRVLIDPAGEAGLDALDARLRHESGMWPAGTWADLIHGTKRMIADTIQVAEIRRLVRALPSLDQAHRQEEELQDALAELLACFPVYRSYLPAGREHLDAAAAEAIRRRPDLADTVRALVPVLADPSQEVARRFQQTTGPVMAKGVEDTAFYRYTRLGALTEVGGDPSEFALPVAGFHRAQAARLASWPSAMTTLSTHDTKRGEDVRARLAVLSEIPKRWAQVLDGFRRTASSGHGPFDALLWQAIVGAWPGRAAAAEPEFAARLHAYAEKAAREAAEATGWWDPVASFETRMHGVVDAAVGAAADRVDAFVNEIAAPGWSNGLSQKVLQLTGPGVPDVYQGSELWELSLVDPDNRRAVDFGARVALLAELDAGLGRGELPPVDAGGAAKLLVTAQTLRLRRDRPDLFTRYTPLPAVGAAAGHAVAADRGGAVVVATRLPVGLAQRGGWDDTVLLRPAGPVRDAFTGRRFREDVLPVAELLQSYPVALLIPEE